MDYTLFDRICQGLCDLLQRAAAVERVLDSVLNLSALSVVEAIDRTDEVAGDTTNTLEGNAIKGVAHIDILAVYGEVDRLDKLIGILLLELIDISVDFCLRDSTACYCYCHVHFLVS